MYTYFSLIEEVERMRIYSDDSVLLEELKRSFLRDDIDVVMKTERVENVLGLAEFLDFLLERININVNVDVDVKADLTKIFKLLINKHYDFKNKKLLLEKSDGRTEQIDTTPLEKGEILEIIDVEIDEDDKLLIVDKDKEIY